MKKVKFVQMGTVGLSKILPVGETGRLTTKDSKGKKRQIRHCLNESSPFVDEQSEFATVSPLVIRKGVIELMPGEDDVTIAFLEVHPGNEANGGKLFRKADPEQEAVSGLEVDDLVTELKYEAKKTEKAKNGFYKLQALASVIEGSYNRVKDKSASELRQIVNSAIDNAPRQFTDEKGNPELFSASLLRNFMSIQAIDRGIVEVSVDGRKIKWADGKTIVDVPAGRKPREFFAEHLGTDDGVLIAERIEKNL